MSLALTRVILAFNDKTEAQFILEKSGRRAKSSN